MSPQTSTIKIRSENRHTHPSFSPTHRTQYEERGHHTQRIPTEERIRPSNERSIQTKEIDSRKRRGRPRNKRGHPTIHPRNNRQNHQETMYAGHSTMKRKSTVRSGHQNRRSTMKTKEYTKFHAPTAIKYTSDNRAEGSKKHQRTRLICKEKGQRMALSQRHDQTKTKK